MPAIPKQQVGGVANEFLTFARQQNALRFGEFTTKAGRLSPYFFNAGKFNTGSSFGRLTDFYARTIVEKEIGFDMLFGPAYKGIPLVAGVAMSLATYGIDKPFAYNRKEEKDHGEGGKTIGADLTGRVLIADDVVSAGTSVRESVKIIVEAGATPAGVMISLDRQERGTGDLSAAQEIFQQFSMQVVAIATLADLLNMLDCDPAEAVHAERIRAYKAQYGAK